MRRVDAAAVLALGGHRPGDSNHSTPLKTAEHQSGPLCRITGGQSQSDLNSSSMQIPKPCLCYMTSSVLSVFCWEVTQKNKETK